MAMKFRDLYDALPAERREQIEEEVRRLKAEMPLHELRRAHELSQEHLARAMNQTQSAISRLERRTDMYVSTLRSYVRAMGGELEIIARFPQGDVRIDQFSEVPAITAEAAAREGYLDEGEEGEDEPATETVAGPPPRARRGRARARRGRGSPG